MGGPAAPLTLTAAADLDEADIAPLELPEAVDETGEIEECHPWGVFVRPHAADDVPRIGVRVGDGVLDLCEAATAHRYELSPLLTGTSLDLLLAAGPPYWQEIHAAAVDWAKAGDHVLPLDRLRLRLPFTVGDYVDFYASEHHARRLAGILRPGQPPLPPAWPHQPLGYHGRSGTVVVSGTEVPRPVGHVGVVDGRADYGPTRKLDVECEIGFVVGRPGRRPVTTAEFADHVFGLVVLNDWSARDLQAMETVPLGPFTGKSFQTSVSPWVVPLHTLATARMPVPASATPLSTYLLEPEPWGLDLELELRVDGELVSRPPYATMHWSPAQLLAHLTVNGASLRTGDLFASGTVSGPDAGQEGSLIEAWGNERFLADRQVVTIAATAPGLGGGRLDLGSVTGMVRPGRSR